MSKGYTIQYFIDTFTNTTPRQVETNGVYNTVSPRFGYSSVKARALDNWLRGETDLVADGSFEYAALGKTTRARVLKALRLRQQGKL